jgi:formylglycine-generating enzyme required for sulfatase activity
MWAPLMLEWGPQSRPVCTALGGNVAEWTATWTADNRFPCIKGGSFIHQAAAISYKNEEPGSRAKAKTGSASAPSAVLRRLDAE